MKKRLGKFYISRQVIDGPEIPEVFKQLSFVPYRVELLADRDEFEYIGTSPAFEELEKGKSVPTYNIILENKYNKDTDKTEIKKVSALKQTQQIGPITF